MSPLRGGSVAALAAFASVVLMSCSGASSKGDPDGLGVTTTSQPTTRTASPSPPTPARSSGPRVIRTIARGLAAPWGLAFLPDGSALVGERDTTKVFSLSRSGDLALAGVVEEAAPQGEAGLLGLAVSPSYAEDRLVYAYVSTSSDNRVLKMRYAAGELGAPTTVLDGIPNGFIHDGGRLLFDSDGNLFVSTGETGHPELAQQIDSLGGKILHITPAGAPAPDNPVPGSPVWTMGHRNVQGLAFDSTGQLWATEFGADTWDELNRIDRGRNYGWPLAEGKSAGKEFRDPFVQWRTSEASPSGLAFADGYLWAASLRGERLWRIPVEGGGVGQPEDFFVGHYGRLRTVVAAPDGNLWVTTSNRDGRGTPRPEDDRILLIRP